MKLASVMSPAALASRLQPRTRRRKTRFSRSVFPPKTCSGPTPWKLPQRRSHRRGSKHGGGAWANCQKPSRVILVDLEPNSAAYPPAREHMSLRELQALECLDALVANVGAPEVERFELLQSREIRERGVANLGLRKVQFPQPGQILEVDRAGVGDRTAGEKQPAKIVQLADILHVLIGGEFRRIKARPTVRESPGATTRAVQFPGCCPRHPPSRWRGRQLRR